MNNQSENEVIRLNKFLAHAGIDNRRNCESLIKKGLVKVNGEIVTDHTLKISLTDKVEHNGEIVKSEKKVYILINKPKKFIYESEDDNQLSLKYLIRSFSEKLNLGYSPKLFPLLDLEKENTGLMLISNDEDLISIFDKKNSNKNLVYTISIDKRLSEKDIIELLNKKNEPHLTEIHFLNEEQDNISVSMKVKYCDELITLFEKKGYQVLKCDRVILDDLNKKNLPRGKWRFLKPNEVIKLKYLKY